MSKKNRSGSTNPASSNVVIKYTSNPNNLSADGLPHADMTSAMLSAYNNNLVGKILTIVDATGLEEKAKKAVKDLIKSATYDAFFIVKDWMQEGNEGKGSNFPYDHNYSLE